LLFFARPDVFRHWATEAASAAFHQQVVEKSWPQRIATQRWTQVAQRIDVIDVFSP